MSKTWEQLQRPITGLHWWYRLLTGWWFTFPYLDDNKYWKDPIKQPDYSKLNGLTYLEYDLKRRKRCKILK